jgi:hypothetical protein
MNRLIDPLLARAIIGLAIFATLALAGMIVTN